jgi:hypothetical protein
VTRPLIVEQEALCQRLEQGAEPTAAMLIRQRAEEIDLLWDRLNRAYAIARREMPSDAMQTEVAGGSVKTSQSDGTDHPLRCAPLRARFSRLTCIHPGVIDESKRIFSAEAGGGACPRYKRNTASYHDRIERYHLVVWPGSARRARVIDMALVATAPAVDFQAPKVAS